MKRALVVFIVVLFAGLLCSEELFASSTRTIKKEFKVKEGKELELDLESGGSIDISGWDKNVVAVEVRIRGRDAEDVEVEFDERSSGVKIHSHYEGRRRNRKTNIHFDIKVPEKFNLSISTHGGGINISNVEGNISGETMGGELELERITGEVHLETMGGSVTVMDSDVDGEVKTMGGSVHIEDVVGDIKGSTMGGRVTYRNVKRRSGKAGKEIHISTMGGDIELDYAGQDVRAKTYGGDIDVSRGEKVEVTTMGGDINVDEAPQGAEVTTMGGDIAVHTAGEYVKAKTMGGDIEIDAVDGWVKATTMGGDITVTMVGDPDKGKREVELKSMGGDIELEVPAGLSMTFDIELAYTKKSHQDYRIESDFDMNIEKTDEWEYKDGSKRKYIYGTGEVKGGKHLIKIRTINGNICISKGK